MGELNMLNALQSFISNLFSDNAFLGTIFASMLPVIEARGAIPLGLSAEFWSTPLNPLLVFFASLVGSAIMTLLLLLATYPICTYLKKLKFVKGFINKLENKVAKYKNNGLYIDDNSINIPSGQTNKNGVNSNQGNLQRYIFLCLFTALPVPLTGYYTACLIASFCNLNKIKAFIAIICGNLICISLMLMVSLIAKQYVTLLFYFFLVAFVLTIIYFIIDAIVKQRKKVKQFNFKQNYK